MLEVVLTGIRGMLFVCFLLSFVWLSTLRGVLSCGAHGPGSRLGLLGLFILGFVLRSLLKAENIKQNLKP